MIGRAIRQASLFYLAFANEAALISDDRLDPLEPLWEDSRLLDLASQALAKRSARSSDFGRPSIAPDRLLRCVVLKHLKGWSFRQLESELRASLLYRRFTRFYEDAIPDFSSFEGIAAWRQLQDTLLKISALNKERLMESRHRKKSTFATSSS